MIKKKILILAPYCSLPNEPYFNRFLYLAELLAPTYDVTLITSSFRHFDKKQRSNVSVANFKIKLIYEPGYKKNVSISRLYSHFVFCRNFKEWITENCDFDLIYSAYPLIETNIILANLKSEYGFKLVVDVQDVWPESISSVLPIFSKVPLKLLPFTKKANTAYSSADALVAVSETYLNRSLLTAEPGTPSRVAYIGSGVVDFKNSPRKINNKNFKLVYIGTLSYSYDVETIIRGVHRLNKENYGVELHILGGGPFEEKLKKINGKGVFFHGFVQYNEMVKFVYECDVAINPLAAEAKQSVTNKLSDYLAIGIPLINSQRNKEVTQLISSVDHEHYNAGCISSFQDAVLRLHVIRDKLSFKPNHNFDRRIGYIDILDLVKETLLDA